MLFYLIGLKRCRKSCRLRWLNYLKPNIKRGEFSEDEVDLMIKLHKLLGNRFVFCILRILENIKVVKKINNEKNKSNLI